MDKGKKMSRPEFMGRVSRQRFEQEVAEEIGLSLDRKLGRASRKARNEAGSPGAAGTEGATGAMGERPNQSPEGR